MDAGVEYTLPANRFTRSGYTFAGWNTRADGTGTSVKDKGTVKVTSDVVLYAQWTKNATASTSKASTLAKTGDASSLVSAAALAAAGAVLVGRRGRR